MKKEKYIVEIEMPDGDTASSMYIQDVIQSDCDIEDEGRWKVSVKEYWKLSEEQLNIINTAAYIKEMEYYGGLRENLLSIYEQLKQL